MKPIRLVLTIDTECDKGKNWEILRPLSFESVVSGIKNVLSPLFERYGIRPTYLLSPEVMRDESSVEVLRSLSNVELGTHLHGEFIGPEEHWAATTTSLPQSCYHPEVEYYKLKNLTSLFEKSFGYRPLSFRGGRFSLSQRTLIYLAELGYEVDTTVTPFRTNTFETGPTANYWGASLRPYCPRKLDPRRKGDLPLLEVPVSIVAPFFRHWPKCVLRELNDRLVSKIARRLRWANTKRLWVRPFRGTSSELITWSDAIIDGWNDPWPVVLNIMFHSNESWLGTSPYTLHEKGLAEFKNSLDLLLAHLVCNRKAEPLTLTELAKEHAE